MELAPIVLFVYNRPWHSRQTVMALQKNELASESELFIYSDAAANEQNISKVHKVRTYIKTVGGFKKVTIIEREKNWGLAASIIDGVSNIVRKYGKIIVLEDDLVTSPSFLKFMNNALDIYKDETKVASIHGYIYPIKNLPETFFIKGADCWGWATWDRAWKHFEPNGKTLLNELEQTNSRREADFNDGYGYAKMLEDQINGKVDSWAIRWYMTNFLLNKLTLYPGKSLIQNIGNDNSGTHSESSGRYDINLQDEVLLHKIEVIQNEDARNKFEEFFKSSKKSFIQRLIKKIKLGL